MCVCCVCACVFAARTPFCIFYVFCFVLSLCNVARENIQRKHSLPFFFLAWRQGKVAMSRLEWMEGEVDMRHLFTTSRTWARQDWTWTENSADPIMLTCEGPTTGKLDILDTQPLHDMWKRRSHHYFEFWELLAAARQHGVSWMYNTLEGECRDKKCV